MFSAVKHWFAENDLLLNVDKSELILVGSSQQLMAASNVSCVSVAGVCLPVSLEIKSLGVVIDSRLTFDTHVRSVCKACNDHNGHCVIYVIIYHYLLHKHWPAASWDLA
jgi:hypothetical protein